MLRVFMNCYFSFISLSAYLFLASHALAQMPEPAHKTPAEIQEELDEDETLFKHAQEMFNPWYAGPLITGGGSTMPAGTAGIQPYLFVTTNYGAWDRERHSIETPNLVSCNPQLNFQFGITSWLDMSILAQGFANWEKDQSSGGYGDMSVSLGIALIKESLSLPAVKLSFSESFPSGRYEHLNPHKLGLDATGSGCYKQSFGIRASKIFFWSYKHPMNLRFSYTYTVPTTIRVEGFNAYGGGRHARGTVRPGNSSALDFAFEYSFTQNWVFANDFVYTWADRTKFSGNPGTALDGTPATVGGGSNDQFSLAPAIEYNPNPNFSVVAGAWFDVYGRNTPKFASGIITVSYTFGW